MQIFFRRTNTNTTDAPLEEDFKVPSLEEELKKTRYALELAYAGFDEAVETDLIDFYIFEINSLLKKYKFLSEQIGVTNPILEKDLYPQAPVHTLVSEVL